MVVSIDSARHYRWGDECDGWHLVSSDALSVIEERVPAGAAEVMHYHHRAEQFFYVLSGIATLTVEETIVELKARQGLHVPAEKTHQLCNRHAEVLSFLVISTPPSHGDRVNLK